MRRAVLGAVAAVLAIGGPAVALFIAGKDRSACPVGGGPCAAGSTYALFHPGPAAFDHVFGALLFLAIALVPLVAAAFLAWRYTFNAPGKAK